MGEILTSIAHDYRAEAELSKENEKIRADINTILRSALAEIEADRKLLSINPAGVDFVDKKDNETFTIMPGEY